ncbi:hypothetical protein MHYP_G00078610 [Metynnis hypsauchen]
MGRLFFSLIVVLVLSSVWCDDSQPVHTEADTLRELLELFRSMAHKDRQPAKDTGLDSSPDEMWPDTESVEKRDLPRLGVSIYRPLASRVQSSKSMDASRNRFYYPAERMARLHG